MKTYNSPGQARSLREIEAAAIAPSKQITSEINGTVQPVSSTSEKEEEKETRPEAQAEAAPQKARSKKNPKEV